MAVITQALHLPGDCVVVVGKEINTSTPPEKPTIRFKLDTKHPTSHQPA
jgi:hypothetical protein